MKEIKTNDGKKGGWLVGKRHYDKSGKSLGGIKAIVTDAGGKPVELEGGEVIINREASKKYWKELSRINQSEGNGVAIGPPSGFDEDPEDNYENGGKIDFNPNHIPNKWILSYAEKIKANHPEIWKLGGNIFGNEAFNNLKRVADRGHWLDSEEWMYIKWRAYVARHIHDFRIEGVVAMLKWVDKVEKGWPYMKQLIEEKINKIESKKKGWKHKTTKMKTGGPIKMGSKKFMQWYIDWYKGISHLINITFSLPNQLLPFKENNVVIFDLFEKKNQKIDAKKYLQEIVNKADELGVVIYLEPKPRHKYFFTNEAKKKKITKEYLIDYYTNFGFEVTQNKKFMKRLPQMKTGGIANDSDSLTVTKYILNRHPKKDDIFQGGKVDGYKIIKIKKLKKDFGIVYHILILDTKKNAEGKFNKRIISYRPESKKITDFLESNLTATKGTYYTQWDDSELQSKMKTGGSVNTSKSFVIFFKSKMSDEIIYVPIEDSSISLDEAIERQRNLYSWMDIKWIKGFEANKGTERLELFLQNMKDKWETNPDLSVKIKNGQIVFSKGRDSVAFDVAILFKVVSTSEKSLTMFNRAHMTNGNTEIIVDDNFNFDKNKVFELILNKMKGGGSVAQTPAPKKDQIKGSDVNKSGSSATTKSASSIKFDEKTIESINNKVKEHNQKHPDKKITLASAKAVVRRGMGAYSSSHRPTITGGQPNSRVAWGIARLNAFTYKIVHGKSKSGKYTQDDDLIEELGYSVSKFNEGGELAMGIKAEHEHSHTIDKFKRKGVSDLDIETAIAKDHLKEDPNYYSKLAQMEGKKYATGGLIISGVEINIGDTVKIKAKGVPNGRRIKITNITDKWVIFTDLADNKRKDNSRDAFLKNFIEKEGGVSTPTNSKPNLNTLTDKEKDFLILKVLEDLSEYIKQGAGFIDPEYALQSFVTSIQDEGYEVDLPLDETIQKRIFIFLSLKDLLFTTKDGENKDKKISSDEAFKLMNPKASQTSQSIDDRTKKAIIDDKIKKAIEKFKINNEVKNLPSGLLSRVYANQIAQGNTQESNIELEKPKRKGNFNWDESPEGQDFWSSIGYGNWTNKDVLSIMGSKEAFFEVPGSTVSTPITIDLTNTKIRINSEEESKLFQEFAIKQGAKWPTSNEVSYTSKPYLFLNKFLLFSYSDAKSMFDSIESKEITLEELGLKPSPEATEIGVKQKEIQTHKHQNESEIQSERDLLVDEYNDITFLISITPSTDVDNMLALKQQSKELKDKLDALDLELKKKIDGEVNLLDNLFKSSTVKPQERYQLKPYNDGFAPNGQPTELPKNIYDWTMTEEFINWFGNFTTAYNYKNSGYLNTPCSVVVNKNYEPLIVYHGTGSEFSFFKFDKFPAMYFAENVDYSNWFAEIKGREIGTNGYIYPFFLNIRTPLDLTHFKIDDVSPQDFIDWMFLQTGLDEEELKINKALLNPNGKYKAWMFLRNSPEMLQVLRDKNVCDGVIYYEDNPSVDKTSSAYQTKAYIVFNSNSAKIADPSRDKLTVSAMRSFYLKKGGKV